MEVSRQLFPRRRGGAHGEDFCQVLAVLGGGVDVFVEVDAGGGCRCGARYGVVVQRAARRADSEVVARDALDPAPVTPTRAEVQNPPSRVTDAATPTIAKWDALLAILA